MMLTTKNVNYQATHAVYSSHFVNKLFGNLPNEATDLIIEFLGYKLRNKKYIKQLPKNLKIYKLLSQMSDVIYYDAYEYLDEYDSMAMDNNAIANLSNNLIMNYFMGEFSYCITFDLSFAEYHRQNTVKTMEIYYSFYDRSNYKVVIKYYFLDYDDSRHEFIPYNPW